STLDPVSADPYGNILFAGIFDNNLYTIDGQDKLQVKYRVDFGEYNLTEEELESSDREEITKLWQDGKRKTYLDHVNESNDYVGFTFWLEDKMEFCIFSKHSDRVLCSEYIQSNDFIMGNLVEITEDHFVLAV